MNKLIGARLKLVRISLKKGNQTEFAGDLGVNQTTISKYEKGILEIPDEVKIKIGEFGINLHWLISGQGEMFLPKPVEKKEKHSSVAEFGAIIDQRLEKIESQIAQNIEYIETRLAVLEARPRENDPDSGLFVSEPEPEYGVDDFHRILYVENIAAGPPIQQSEDLSHYIDVPRRFIKTKPEDYYAARIRGESMTAAGIPDGCTVLIHRSDVPRNGAIQVVRCGGKSTLKRMREGEDHTWKLRFEDNSYRLIPIGPEEEFQVQGDFVAVLLDDE